MKHLSRKRLYNGKACRCFETTFFLNLILRTKSSSESRNEEACLETLTSSIVHGDSPPGSLFKEHLTTFEQLCLGSFRYLSQLWKCSGPRWHFPWDATHSMIIGFVLGLVTIQAGWEEVSHSSSPVRGDRWTKLPGDSAGVACMTVSSLTSWGPHPFSLLHCWSLTTVHTRSLKIKMKGPVKSMSTVGPTFWFIHGKS